MREASVHASETLIASVNRIAESALQLQWRRWPGLRESFSEPQYLNAIKDTRYHIQFLASALWAGEQALYDDYVRWVKVLFENLSLPAEWLSCSLEDVRDAIANELDTETAVQSTAVINRSLDALSTVDVAIPTYITPDQPLSALAIRYLGAALSGDRHGASRSILDAVSSGTPVRDVYTHVFQPAQLELGRLWQLNRISVAQEHCATAITELVMSQLYGEIFTAEIKDRMLVAACVGEELHEMGLRMVTDFFEMDKWNTHYLGANMPAASIVETTAERQADVLALSATMSYHIREVAEIIRMLRTDERTSDVKVLVGGYTFNTAPTLWKRVGADGFARSAQAALEIGRRLVAS
ncbi:MAG: cobalamin-dependent protein [Actinomycetota bacterium]|nr:MAG: cobalamin B12-binding domain [Actinomycetota bacterium]MDO8950414.1 cobalamin-dependent protein [Actinomycetota bacterium]MDP3630784.1 cobalamin-dependent protein [Actinomycetota bacterium]